MENYENYEIRPDVINVDDVIQMVPKLKGHEKLVERVLRFLQVDEVNRVHGSLCDTPGPEFSKRLIYEDFKISLRIDNEELLNNLPEGAFITVSNHPYGALDGIILIYLISSRRPEFKVMVNMILNKISAMRPNFIAVDAMQSNDPEKRKISINGIRQTMRQLKEGHPVGFFPAGAMSKINWKYQQVDREWQPTVVQIIQKAKVPIIPIFFHGGNSFLCNILGRVCWPARSLRLPAEVFRKRGTEIHVSVGDVISVDEQLQHQASLEEFSKFLRDETYKLRKIH
ncbi:MAG: 1-acyl-sn-glycerol-3-phosphate acyltransferase [Muribaculaceae bacterium]|nr:1-acyl-sn-glycerol-3-phosphate acyltransferase [Muribaculaceae bacterium]